MFSLIRKKELGVFKKTWFTKKGYFLFNTIKATWFLLFLLFIIPRIVGLGTDISNSDAYRWHKRASNFISAIKTYKFIDTYQRYHPGVTLMWVSGITQEILFKFQQVKGVSPKTLETKDWYPVIHSLVKIILVAILS